MLRNYSLLLVFCLVSSGCGDDDGGPRRVTHAGVTAQEDGGLVVLGNGIVEVRADLGSGTFEVHETGGLPLLLGAESRVRFQQGEDTFEAGTSDPGRWTWTAQPRDDALGSGVRLILRHEPEEPGPVIQTVIDLRAQTGFLTARCEAIWDTTETPEPRVLRLSPIAADTLSGGAFFLGPDPETHLILDNGYDLYLDFEARVVPVGTGESALFGPGTSANWNMAVHDPDTGVSMVAGFLSAHRGLGITVAGYSPHEAVEDNGRLGFTRLEGLTEYMDGRALIPGSGGNALSSELFYLDLLPETVFDGLEQFAGRYAQRIGKVLWTDVPAGWNSWGGGAGSGGLGTTIDASLMLANLDAAATDFLPYGMEHFMLDDGWQIADGDWQPNQDRFPDQAGQNGMAWFADQVRDRGMIPGIWVSPYTVDMTSQLAADHPDWMAALNTTGESVVPQDQHILDLSHPEVLDWLEETFRRITRDWGYRWIKMDFSYYALFTQDLHDPDVSVSEAYRNALSRIREAIGGDTFLLTISATGLCLDLADGGRITLDNEPWWGDSVSMGEQGIKPTYKTVARRYYLNHALWINHPDLVFYRPDFDLTLNEARAFTSVVALSGGIVKLGETYTDMHLHPEWRALVTPLLPVYPATGRPLDLFLREYPEVWDLPVEREGHTWHVVGLFNWGRNRDIGEFRMEDEETHTYTVDLDTLGLDPSQTHLAFNAWDHTWEWLNLGQLQVTLDPRTEAVVILREEPLLPAVVATTRHLLGGAVEVHNETWSDTDSTLSAHIDTVPDDPTTVYVADAGQVLDVVEVTDASDASTMAANGILSVSFVPRTIDTTVTLRFLGSN